LLAAGQIAPNFSLEGDDSHIHGLNDLLGQNLVIFFYPKDLTPGCTTQACEFNDALDNFHKLSTNVIGISKDNLASHARFKSKHALRMLLLSDPDLAVHKQYDAYGHKKLYGKTTMGVIRSTFIIDKNGTILRTWHNVRVKNHVQAVLDALTKL